MAIAALDPNGVLELVSESDPAYNEIVQNQSEIDAWKALSAKQRADTPEPVPTYTHGPSATKWLYGSLSAITMAALADNSTKLGDDGQLMMSPATSDTIAARIALRGWENFPTKFETAPFKFRGLEYDAVTEEALATIPLPIIREIARAAKEGNTLSGIQAKNSG